MGMCSFFSITLLFTVWLSRASVLDLNTANFLDVLKAHEFVLVNFYAEWCRFSRDLAPIFMSTGESVAQEFKDGKVVLGRVDCDDQGALCMSQGVSKYPTLRLFKFTRRYGSEYRNQRSVEAFLTYLREQTADPVKKLNSAMDVGGLTTPRNMVGIFPSFTSDNAAYMNFYMASHLVGDCTFYGVADKNATASVIKFLLKKYPPTEDAKPQQLTLVKEEQATVETVTDFEALRSWAVERCTPLVRELTFANAEEITEPRLPLLILFYPPNNFTAAMRFGVLMEEHFSDLKGRFVPLVANGEVFSHPLLHMGKTMHDLPLMAIDSFQHMFLYPGNLDEALKDPKHINQFLADLASEKLHRQFHGFFEPPSEVPQKPPSEDKDRKAEEAKQSAPTSSVFKLLTPSSNRYSLLRDEL
ncbi:Thioredoxin fold [Echinococcus multilocularis]|uniref:Thioredoxin fold n=1 Tax=Echinococcus multilocularis TaxID=6211 RepID=A0A068XW94_ECHMU|nr:Thioredoxin fold [Echinococcus multilocularis]